MSADKSVVSLLPLSGERGGSSFSLGNTLFTERLLRFNSLLVFIAILQVSLTFAISPLGRLCRTYSY